MGLPDKVPLLQAVHSNIFNAAAVPGVVRLTFGQQWVKDGDVAWFATVTMNLPDAVSLRDLLDKAIELIKGQETPK